MNKKRGVTSRLRARRDRDEQSCAVFFTLIPTSSVVLFVGIVLKIKFSFLFFMPMQMNVLTMSWWAYVATWIIYVGQAAKITEFCLPKGTTEVCHMRKQNENVE